MAVKVVGALTAIICYIYVAWQVTGKSNSRPINEEAYHHHRE